jgi:predicted Na+-dependent transporter
LEQEGQKEMAVFMNSLFENDVFMRGIEILMHAAFPAVVFVISSKVTFKDLLQEFERPWLLLKTFGVACLIVPLITAGVIKSLNVPLLLGGVMLIASVAPADPFDLLEAKGKKGNISLVSANMALLCLMLPLTAPFWLWAFSQWFPLHLSISPVRIFVTIAPITLLPLLAGIAFHEVLPAFSKILQHLLEWFFRIAIILLALVFLRPAVETILKFNFVSVISIIIVVTLSIFAGYYAGGSNRGDRISLALTASLGNLAAVMVIAHLCYPKVHVWGTVLAWVLLRWLTIMLWYLFLRVRIFRRGESL